MPSVASGASTDDELIGEFEHARTRTLRTVITWWVLLTAFIVIFWELASGTLVEVYWISSPSLVAGRIVEWVTTGYLWRHAGITLLETGLGFLIGASLSLALGLLLGMLPTVLRILGPFLTALYALPKITLGPLLILYFGIGLEMKIVLASTIAFLLVFFNTVDAVRTVDRDLVAVVRVSGASRAALVRTTMLPAALGGILTGMRIALPYTLHGALFGEILASNVGLGYLIQVSASQFDVTGVFSGLVIVTVVAVFLNQIVNVVQDSTQAWRMSQ